MVLIPTTLGVTFFATASTTDSAVSSMFILTLLPETLEVIGEEVLLPFFDESVTAAIPLPAPMIAAKIAAAITVPAPKAPFFLFFFCFGGLA